MDTQTNTKNIVHNVVIIGSGPAGHTAAIYAARAALSPLLFEGWMAGGIAAGGQLTTTSIVENYPGFPDGISGPDLMQKMREQSVRFGTKIITETVESVDLSHHPFTVHTSSQTCRTKTLIIASGAIARRLGVPGEEKYWDKGISACAVCDAALPIFRNKPLLVVGGGDSACEEADFLTKFGSKVYMAVRRNVLRASKAMQERVQKNPVIEILWETEVIQALGTEGDAGVLNALVLKHKTQGTSTISVNGLFYAIGHDPNTEFLKRQVEMDDANYIITKSGSTECSVSGVFACGDVQDPHYRQAISSAGSGCMAAIDVEHWLASHRG